jgi:L-ascorbate metabolism protein UlaG (beta-lactamase superfamily)
MKITKHAQSCLLVETGAAKILIDPGVFVTEKEHFDLNNFLGIDAIVITHEHSDHFSPENLDIIIRNNPTVPIFTTETVKCLFDKENVTVLKDSQTINIKDCALTGVKSVHGPLPNGMEPPEVIGVLIDDGRTMFYDPSDSTRLFVKADIIAEPICGKVVMDIEKAKSEALRVMPRIVFPIHFDNPVFPVDPDDFIKAMADTSIECRLLAFNKSIEA